MEQVLRLGAFQRRLFHACIRFARRGLINNIVQIVRDSRGWFLSYFSYLGYYVALCEDGAGARSGASKWVPFGAWRWIMLDSTYFDEQYRPISGTKPGSYSSLEPRTAFAFKMLLCQPNRPQNLPVTHKGNIGFTHLKVPQLSHFAATLLNSPWRTARKIMSDYCYSESLNLIVNIDRVPYKPHIRLKI
jgi:hypothetical protein